MAAGGTPALPYKFRKSKSLGISKNRLLTHGGLGDDDQFAKGGGIGDGEFRQHFSIDLNARFMESAHKNAIGRAFHLAGGGDADDPQAAEIAFAIAAVAVGVFERLMHAVAGGSNLHSSSKSRTFRRFEYFLSAPAGGDLTDCAWHDVFLSSAMLLRQHAANSLDFRAIDGGLVAQPSFAFGGFLGADMAEIGAFPLKFSVFGFPETLRRSAIGFHFRS